MYVKVNEKCIVKTMVQRMGVALVRTCMGMVIIRTCMGVVIIRTCIVYVYVAITRL